MIKVIQYNKEETYQSFKKKHKGYSGAVVFTDLAYNDYQQIDHFNGSDLIMFTEYRDRTQYYK